VSTAEDLPTLSYEVDPSWPRDLPGGWILGQVGSVCTDDADNVVVLNRRDITSEEAETGENAPAVIVFNSVGDVLHSWGDPELLPAKLHGSFFDHEQCVWITGMHDGIVQKYSWEGELLLQIGTKGLFDSSDGTIEGEPLNAAHDRLFKPSGVAVDPETGDVFVSDGYGNRRVVVFDSQGRFQRQWGRQASPDESRDGVPAAFARVVHGISLSNESLLYVCDRQGNRIQVFELDGTFVRNFWVETSDEIPDARGTAWWVAFSPDDRQRLLYVMDGRNERVRIIERETGALVSSFGRPGHQLGAFTHGHTLAVDSQGSVYVGETDTGRRVQKFRNVASNGLGEVS
jgi:DNA-binding beta-propeller fold protein YncE